MELFFLALLIILMATALGSGYPVAFALPGSAIVTIALAALSGYLFTGDVDAYFAHGSAIQWLSAGVTNFRGVYWEVERDTLIAIPLFIFMGIMLQRSRIAEDLLVTMAQLFGAIPGGLGISVVFVGALLAATTGIVGATVVAMGLISLPAMMRSNYSNALSTGTIAASGTLGQIIPPSIVLIILADQLASAVDQASTARKTLYKETTGDFSMPSAFDITSTSAGDMFLGAFLPGLVLVGLYMAYILIYALARPHLAPAVPREGGLDRAFWLKVLVILVPPLALIFVVLGSIIMGIATVNQAGAIGATGATVMAGARLKAGARGTFVPSILAVLSLIALGFITANFNTNIKNIQTSADVLGITLASISTAVFIIAIVWSGWRVFKIDDTLRGVMVDTAKTTSLVFIILLGAAMLTAAFRAFGGEELVREFLTSLPGGFWAQFIIVMAVIFILGFFLDFIEIAVVVVPIVAPILLMEPSANVTAVWLGVMIGLNIQTSFLTPPFGFALFYLRGVAPAAVRTVQMYKGVIPFILLQLFGLAIVGFYPTLVNYLPNRISLTSETAPPPVNPRLQHCMERYVIEQFETRGDTITSAIERMKGQDISYLPEDVRDDLQEGLQKATEVPGMLEEIRRSAAAVEDRTPEYRPLHVEVRQIQKDIRGVDAHITELEDRLRFLEGVGADADQIAAVKAEIEELQSERAELEAQIPDDWEERHEAFRKLQAAEVTARREYRRATDDAYEPVQELIAILEGTDALADLEDELAALPRTVSTSDPEAALERVEAVRDKVRAIEGTRPIAKPMYDARQALRRTPKPEEAISALNEAIAAFRSEIAWRKRATDELLPELERYRSAIRDTIGLRSLSKLPEDIALYVAACEAPHRDISLSF